MSQLDFLCTQGNSFFLIYSTLLTFYLLNHAIFSKLIFIYFFNFISLSESSKKINFMFYFLFSILFFYFFIFSFFFSFFFNYVHFIFFHLNSFFSFFKYTLSLPFISSNLNLHSKINSHEISL